MPANIARNGQPSSTQSILISIGSSICGAGYQWSGGRGGGWEEPGS